MLQIKWNDEITRWTVVNGSLAIPINNQKSFPTLHALEWELNKLGLTHLSSGEVVKKGDANDEGSCFTETATGA